MKKRRGILRGNHRERYREYVEGVKIGEEPVVEMDREDLLVVVGFLSEKVRFLWKGLGDE